MACETEADLIQGFRSSREKRPEWGRVWKKGEDRCEPAWVLLERHGRRKKLKVQERVHIGMGRSLRGGKRLGKKRKSGENEKQSYFRLTFQKKIYPGKRERGLFKIRGPQEGRRLWEKGGRWRERSKGGGRMQERAWCTSFLRGKPGTRGSLEDFGGERGTYRQSCRPEENFALHSTREKFEGRKTAESKRCGAGTFRVVPAGGRLKEGQLAEKKKTFQGPA